MTSLYTSVVRPLESVALMITLRNEFVAAQKSSGSGAGKRSKSFPMVSSKNGCQWSKNRFKQFYKAEIKKD
jgi:hypothetical protein